MPKVYFELQGEIATRAATQYMPSQIRKKYFAFDVLLDENPNLKAKIEISPHCLQPDETPFVATLRSAKVKTSCEDEISDELLSALVSGITLEDSLPSPSLKSELRQLYNSMLNTTNKTLRLIKYGLNFSDLDEPPFTGPEALLWGEKGSELKYISFATRSPVLFEPDNVEFDNETEKQIQHYIDVGFSPFFALAPLHRAKNERDPRYIIIYAAYAAELAIKEFLVEYTKTEGISPLEPLVLGLPSPPLGQMYGEVLKGFTGKGSPKSGEMGELNTKRNNVMHRPPQKEKEGDLAKAEKYVRDVEAAIFHLLYLLYGETDPIIKQHYETKTEEYRGKKAASSGPKSYILRSGTFRVVERQK
jgi:hypothetical protein